MTSLAAAGAGWRGIWGWVKTNGIPFWLVGEFATHFVVYFSGEKGMFTGVRDYLSLYMHMGIQLYLHTYEDCSPAGPQARQAQAPRRSCGRRSGVWRRRTWTRLGVGAGGGGGRGEGWRAPGAAGCRLLPPFCWRREVVDIII